MDGVKLNPPTNVGSRWGSHLKDERFDDKRLFLPFDLNTFMVKKKSSNFVVKSPNELKKQINKMGLEIVNDGLSIILEVSQMPSNFVI